MMIKKQYYYYYYSGSLNLPDSYDFKYDFENKKDHLIEIGTLLETQRNINIVLQELKKEICPENQLNIFIKPYKEGSFVTQYIPHILAAGTIAFENIDYIKTIFETFGDVMEIWKYFKGEKIQKEQIKQVNNIDAPIIDNRQIILNININGAGNSINVDEKAINFYTKNISGNKAINKIGKALCEDKNINSFILKHKNQTVFATEKTDFENLSKRNQYILDEENREEQVDKTRLYVKKIDVKPDKKATFTFIYHGARISTKINDETFLNKIRSGHKFGNGDSIIANISIFRKFDETVNTYIIKGYTINKVHKIEKNKSQNGKQEELWEDQ